MISGKRQVAILLWLISIYVVGVLIFTKGFLLKRVVVNKNSSCDVTFSHRTEEHEGKGCWMHRRFSKAVVIIIDALKYDFLKFDNSYKLNDSIPHYKNKLPFLNNLLLRNPRNAFLSKFMADPPTTTLQRLKGLTTGSLPTFVDAGSNFASSEITEDNIIDQLKSSGKRLKFMGDDTWTGLFPGRFFKQFPYPSFNVKDLHTVDDGVLEHLIPELKLNDWDVVIAHFLGVDHCGHRFGPNHPAMAEKLIQMNSMLRNVSKVLDKDTVLIVFGDHGMTRTGDHGGDSRDELEAGLFIYSPEILTATIPKTSTRVIAQTDFVPTISLLLGIPIPYSNLGMAVPELFNHCPWSKTATSELRQIYHTVKALRLNAYQVNHFLKSYSEVSKEFPERKYGKLKELFDHAESDLQGLLTAMVTDGETAGVVKRMNKLKDHYETFIQDSRHMCEKIWAKFDLVAITLGLCIMFLSLLINLYFYLAHRTEESLSPICVSLIIASSVIVSYAFLQAFYIGDLMNPFMVYLFIGVLIVTFLILIKKSISFHDQSKERQTKLWNLPEFDNVIATVIVFIYTAGYFSNSFVVHEDTVTMFLAQSLLWCFGIKALMSTNKRNNERNDKPFRDVGRHKKQKFDFFQKFTSANIIIVGVVFTSSIVFRLLQNFRACREEQMPCEETIFLQPLTNFLNDQTGMKNVRYFLSVACLGIFVYMSRLWMKHYGNLNGDTAPVLCAKYLLPFSAVCIAAHWALQTLPQSVLDSLPGWQQVLPAQLVYVSVISIIICLIINPLCLYLLYVKNDNPITIPATGASSPQIIHQVFNQLKQKFTSNGQSSSENPPVVYGLGTVYTSSVLYFTTVVSVLTMLLLGDGIAPSVLLACLSLFLFLEVYSAGIHYEIKDSEVPVVRWSSVVTLGMMSVHFFYGTGHQATIPSLHWNAAFTGFYGNFNNNFLPALLMTINTFASNIIFGLAYPLLLFWPKLSTKLSCLMSGSKKDKSKWQGDFAFFNDGEKIRQTLYQLSLAVMMFSSIKLFGAMGAAGLHRRHLMVWKIFAPRLIFEAAGTIVTYVVLVVAHLFVMRVDNALNKFAKEL